ncbi:hypothetical protein [Hansschlegelia beijingensis]|uniref:Tip attachment protein J domain-containing protein n=1 Tax=Hansschlegelia beijingensis TaxID=1133344 RepID=A0A7W6CX81_9HYPH|nr:hypothetical protein [Hansschlegelia beijingensis]MBB3972788.1 hypothetical protein [Hansschlegelia beijingensis]
MTAGATAIAGTTLASIVGAVALTAAAGVLQYLLAPKPPVPKAQAGYYPLRQTRPPRITGYGEARLAGSYMFYETLGDNSYDVLALHHGKIKEFTRFYLHDDVVTLNPDGTIATSSLDHDYHPETSQVVLLTRRGEATETAFGMVVDAAAAEAASSGKAQMWTAAHRGDGIASLALYCKTRSAKSFPANYPRGVHIPSVAARLSYIYDPRAEGQVHGEPETYEWSDNCALAIADYLTNEDHGVGLTWEECFHDGAEIAVEADICDELVPRKAGGTRRRYRLGGAFQHDNTPADVLATMLATCDGWLAERGDGSLRLLVGKYRAPTVTFRTEHAKAYSVTYGVGDEDAINELTPTYTSPDHEFAEVEGESWRDEEDISERGRTRSERLDLKWVQDHGQARMLCKREMLRSSSRLRGTLVTTLYGLVGLGERWIKLEIDNHPDLADLVVEVVTSPRIDFMSGSVTFEWRSVNPNAVDAWDPNTEEGDPPPVPVRSASKTPAMPTGVEVVIEGSDNAGIYADVVFDYDAKDSMTFLVDLRQVTDDTESSWSTLTYDGESVEIDEVLDTVSLSTQGLAPRTSYEGRIQVKTGSGKLSAYSPIFTFDTFTVAPESPTDFRWDDVEGLLRWRASASTQSVLSRVFRAPAGDPFVDADEITPSGGVPGEPLQQVSFDPPDYSDGWYWVVAESAAGLRSSPTGPLTVETTVI